MEPTLMLAAVAFVGSAVLEKAADQLLEGAWTSLKARWRSETGKELTPETLQEGPGLADDSEFLVEAHRVLQGSPALRRAQLVRRVFEGAEILWIDDNPGNQLWEVLLLQSLGAYVTQAPSSQHAARILEEKSFDAILSDIRRDGMDDEGVRFAEEYRIAENTPLIFFILRVEPGPPPAGAFGITNRVDELIHLLCDVLERCRL